MHNHQQPFSLLLKPVYSEAARYCRALHAARHNAEDLLQDALVIAYQKFDSLKDKTKFKPWLFKIITREFYQFQKRQKRKNRLFTHLKENDTEFPGIFSNEELSDKEVFLVLALDMLTEKERAAILLFEIGGFSISDIMAIQGDLSLSSVKSRLSRSREKLRNIINTLELTNQHEKGNSYDGLKNSLPGR